jgi:hypothetical protein
MVADEWKLEFNKNGVKTFKKIINPFDGQIKDSLLDTMEYDKFTEKFETNKINMVVTKIERKIENDILISLIFHVSEFKFLETSLFQNEDEITSNIGTDSKSLLIGEDKLVVRHSKDVLKYTTDWLFKKGLIKTKDLPVYVPNGKRYLLNKKPEHAYGRPFDGKPHKVSQDVYLLTNFSTIDCITNSKYLMEKFAPNITFKIIGF